MCVWSLAGVGATMACAIESGQDFGEAQDLRLGKEALGIRGEVIVMRGRFRGGRCLKERNRRRTGEVLKTSGWECSASGSPVAVRRRKERMEVT